MVGQGIVSAGLAVGLLLSGCNSHPQHPTFRCDGNDEVYTGEEGPCPRTGTVSGVVSSFMGGIPNDPVMVTLHAAHHIVPAKRTDAAGRVTFKVSEGRYTATTVAFGVTCTSRPFNVVPDKHVNVVLGCSEP